MGNYYNYYKKKKETKPFKFVKRKTGMVNSRKKYQELKEEFELSKEQMNPISEETFTTILKAAIKYAKDYKN